MPAVFPIPPNWQLIAHDLTHKVLELNVELATAQADRRCAAGDGVGAMKRINFYPDSTELFRHECDGEWVRFEEAEAEIARLRALLSGSEAARKNMHAQVVAQGLEVDRLRALVAKRERQLIASVREAWGLTLDGRVIVFDDYYHKEWHFDGTDAGLLAAVDEAIGETQ